MRAELKRSLFVVFVLLLSDLALGQTSYTESYNQYLQQYEFYDSYGNLVGTKKWNSYLNQWEISTNNRGYNGGHQYLPRVSPINTNAVGQALMYKQQRYDNNVRLIQDKINYINNLYASKRATENRKEYWQSITNEIDKMNRTNNDWSDASLVNYTLGWFNDVERNIRGWD